jgi:enamine deaminase RidA (YjgF/YER057c/UK114 family)
MPAGADPPADTYGQTRRVLEIMLGALAEAGAGPEHVVRTRIFLGPDADFDEAARAHGEVFSDIRPASTMLFVSALADPRWHVEMEAQALLD